MTQTPFNLDLDEYLDGDETCLAGRIKGEAILARMKGAGIDWIAMEADGPIVVTIPNRIVTMNRSFFEAVWGRRVKSLRRLGFVQKYTFVTSEHIMRKALGTIQELSFRGILQDYDEMEYPK